MRRIQRQRTKGWRLPAGAVIVSRPSRWGNPFLVTTPWLAIALGRHADAAGRRDAAVAAYRAWMTGEPVSILAGSGAGAALEYTDGTVRTVSDIVVALGLRMLSRSPIRLPPKPELAPLRGKDLVCWCPLDGQPCHADVLLELLR